MDGTTTTMGMRTMAWAFGKAFLTALVLTPIVRDIFHAYNVVDRPGLRKVHAYPIPRLGGISIAAAYLIGFVGLLNDSALAWKLLPAAGVIFATGVLDDFVNLSPRLKLLGQILAACIAFGSGLRVPLSLSFDWTPLSFLLTVGWLLLTANAFNLVDGLDGLCSGVGLIATIALWIAASLVPGTHPSLAVATLPLAGAVLGFLCHNFSRATVFLGDSGALLIGFLAGCFGLLWTEQASGRVSMIFPVLAMSIPLLDLCISIVRRSIQQRPIFSADRRHMHHRLLDRGFTPRRAVLLLYLWAITGSVLGLLLANPALSRGAQVLVIVCFCATTWAGIRQLRYSEFKVAARLLFRGEFQRVLKSKMRIQNLAESLNLCKSEDEWWTLLTDAAREAGCGSIEWKSGDFVRRNESLLSASKDGQGASENEWLFEIPLGSEEVVRVSGPLPSASPSFDLLAFAEAMQGSFAAHHLVWQRAELS